MNEETQTPTDIQEFAIDDVDGHILGCMDQAYEVSSIATVMIRAMPDFRDKSPSSADIINGLSIMQRTVEDIAEKLYVLNKHLLG